MANRHAAGGKQPSHVAPEEAPLRRLHVCVSIRIPVVMPVMPHPPEGAILAGKNTEEGENELEQPAGLERAVCEQSMIACGDPEDLKRAGDQECRHRWAAQADKKNQSAAQMQQDKGCERMQCAPARTNASIGLRPSLD
jgi:hypothetical protein